MPLPLQSRSSGTRVQEISRQFTAPERAIDDRITSHLTSPMPQATGIDAATGYKWLEDDLRFRAQMTSQLNQERDLANAQSVRQELDRKFTQDTQDEAAGIAAIREMDTALQAPGAQFKDVAADFFSKNPELGNNKSFMENLAIREKLHENDTTRKIRELGEQRAIVGSQLAIKTDGERIRFLTENEPALRVMEQEKLELERLGMADSKRAFELKDMMDDVEFEKAQSARRALAANNGLPQDAATRLGVKAGFKNAGIAPSNADGIAKHWGANPSVSTMLVHPSFLKRRLGSPEAVADFTKVLEDSVDETLPEAERAKAREKVEYIAVDFTAETQRSADRADLNKRVEAVGSEIGKSAADFSKDLTTLRNKKTEYGDDPAMKDASARQMFGEWSSQISMGNVGPLEKAIHDDIETWLTTDGKDADVATVSSAFSKYAKDIAEARKEDQVVGYQGKTAKAAAARAAADPKSAAGGAKTLTPGIVAEYKARAKGDKAEAMKLLQADGYKLP